LSLSAPFHGRGHVDPPSQIEKMEAMAKRAASSSTAFGPAEHALHFMGDPVPAPWINSIRAEASSRPPDLAEIKGGQGQGGHLGGEGLRRGDADLGTGVGIKDAVGFPGDRGTHGIG